MLCNHNLERVLYREVLSFKAGITIHSTIMPQTQAQVVTESHIRHKNRSNYALLLLRHIALVFEPLVLA